MIISQLGRPYVISKMNDYPDFQAVAVAIERSGFKVSLKLLKHFPIYLNLSYMIAVVPYIIIIH